MNSELKTESNLNLKPIRRRICLAYPASIVYVIVFRRSERQPTTQLSSISHNCNNMSCIYDFFPVLLVPVFREIVTIYEVRLHELLCTGQIAIQFVLQSGIIQYNFVSRTVVDYLVESESDCSGKPHQALSANLRYNAST